MLRRKLGFALVAGLLAIGLSSQASAVPISAGGAATTAAGDSAVEKIDYRSYRHCHKRKRHGRWYRWCHGPHYGSGYYPYYGPGINLYFGPRYRYPSYRGRQGGYYGHHYGGRRGR